MSATRLFRYLPEVLLATCLVLVGPLGVVLGIEALGWLHSTIALIAIGMGLSLALSYAGGLFWRARTGSNDLMFGELMLWGWFRRLRIERQLSSVVGLLVGIDESPDLSRTRRQELLTQLAQSLEARDAFTHGHSRRVARSAVMIAKRLDLPESFVAKVRAAALLHDVGKLKTPTSVLHKPGRLTDEEFDIIKRHPGDGAEMVAVLGDPELTAMVRSHHERLDGTGYPDRLPGLEIPLGARIISVADTFDAITSIRPYRGANAHKKALDILEKEAGTQLDPNVVRAFRSCYFGRRPAMVWASLTNIPLRLISWFGDGLNAATAASVARVAAVSAVTAAAGTTGVSAKLLSNPFHQGGGAKAPLVALLTGGGHASRSSAAPRRSGGTNFTFHRVTARHQRQSHVTRAAGVTPQAAAAAFQAATTSPTPPAQLVTPPVPTTPSGSGALPPVISGGGRAITSTAGPTSNQGSSSSSTTSTASTTTAQTTTATTTENTTTAATTTESVTTGTQTSSTGTGPIVLSPIGTGGGGGGGGTTTTTSTTTSTSSTSASTTTESTTSTTTESTTTSTSTSVTDTSTSSDTSTTSTDTTTSTPATTTTTSTTTSTTSSGPATCTHNCGPGVDNSLCHDHCSGSNDTSCREHCSGTNDTSCFNHCSGANDTSCHDHCVGNPPSCHDHCNESVDAAAAAADVGAPVITPRPVHASHAGKRHRRGAPTVARRPRHPYRPVSQRTTGLTPLARHPARVSTRASSRSPRRTTRARRPIGPQPGTAVVVTTTTTTTTPTGTTTTTTTTSTTTTPPPTKTTPAPTSSGPIHITVNGQSLSALGH